MYWPFKMINYVMRDGWGGNHDWERLDEHMRIDFVNK